MTLNEKIERLCELARQREAIDKEIEALLGPEEKLLVPTTKFKLPAEHPFSEDYKLKKRKIKKNVNKSVEKTPVKKVPGKYDSKRYFCLDCKDTFISEARKIDAVCPACSSVHVDYASVYKK